MALREAMRPARRARTVRSVAVGLALGLGIAGALQILPANAASAGQSSKVPPEIAPSGVYRGPVPDEMKPLQKFNGTWDCLVTDQPAGGQHRAIVNIYPILKGHWQQWDGLEIPSADFPTRRIGHWIYGFDTGKGKFINYLYDDQGNNANETSEAADWQDGHFILAGPSLLLGHSFNGRDDFVFKGPDRWLDTYHAQIDGQWTALGTTECTRIR